MIRKKHIYICIDSCIYTQICVWIYSTSQFEDNEQNKQTPLRGLIRLVSHLPVSTKRETRVTPSKGTPRLMESWRVESESSQFSFHATHRNASESYSRYQYLSDCIKMPPLGNLPAYQRGPKTISVCDSSVSPSSSRAAKHLWQCTISIFFKTWQQFWPNRKQRRWTKTTKSMQKRCGSVDQIHYVYLYIHYCTWQDHISLTIWWCMM